MNLAAHAATGLERVTAVVACVMAAGFVFVAIATAVRWKRVRHADDRAEALRLALGRRGAVFFLVYIFVGAAVLISLGIAVGNQR